MNGIQLRGVEVPRILMFWAELGLTSRNPADICANSTSLSSLELKMMTAKVERNLAAILRTEEK